MPITATPPPHATRVGFFHPSKVEQLTSSHRDPLGPARTKGEIGDPWQLKALAPHLYDLDRVRRRFGKELRRKPNGSKVSQTRREAIKSEIDATLARFGGPFIKPDVRARAFQIINPYRRWSSGTTAESRVQHKKLEDATHWIPTYDTTYGRDPDMTPAFAALIEAAKELRRVQMANPKSKGQPCLSTSDVFKLLASFGFITDKLSTAAKLLVTTPKVTKSKPKRKTASLKKTDPHIQGA